MVGLGFSLYLTHIEKDVLQVWCLYCVGSLGIIAIITLLSLGWAIVHGQGRKWPPFPAVTVVLCE